MLPTFNDDPTYTPEQRWYFDYDPMVIIDPIRCNDPIPSPNFVIVILPRTIKMEKFHLLPTTGNKCHVILSHEYTSLNNCRVGVRARRNANENGVYDLESESIRRQNIKFG